MVAWIRHIVGAWKLVAGEIDADERKGGASADAARKERGATARIRAAYREAEDGFWLKLKAAAGELVRSSLEWLGIGVLTEGAFPEIIDSRPAPAPDEVVREVVTELRAEQAERGGGEEPSAADLEAREQSTQEAPAPEPPVDVLVFLERVREREAENRDLLDARLTVARGRETTLFMLLLALGVITAVLAVLVVVLLVLGLTSVAIASAAVGLLPGAGTLLLRQLWRREGSRVERLEADRDEHGATLDSIEFTLSLPGEAARTEKAEALAERLQERAFSHSRSSG